MNYQRLNRLIKSGLSGGVLIMIVDDDPVICETLKGNLEKSGFTVSTVADGIEAMEKAKMHAQDVIFINVRIPALNGLMIFIEMKKINPNVCAIMVSTQKEVDISIANQAIKEGAFACLYKPFNMADVVSITQEISKNL